jgi:hypothetical protein
MYHSHAAKMYHLEGERDAKLSGHRRMGLGGTLDRHLLQKSATGLGAEAGTGDDQDLGQMRQTIQPG